MWLAELVVLANFECELLACVSELLGGIFPGDVECLELLHQHERSKLPMMYTVHRLGGVTVEEETSETSPSQSSTLESGVPYI